MGGLVADSVAARGGSRVLGISQAGAGYRACRGAPGAASCCGCADSYDRAFAPAAGRHFDTCPSCCTGDRKRCAVQLRARKVRQGSEPAARLRRRDCGSHNKHGEGAHTEPRAARARGAEAVTVATTAIVATTTASARTAIHSKIAAERLRKHAHLAW